MTDEGDGQVTPKSKIMLRSIALLGLLSVAANPALAQRSEHGELRPGEKVRVYDSLHRLQGVREGRSNGRETMRDSLGRLEGTSERGTRGSRVYRDHLGRRTGTSERQR